MTGIPTRPFARANYIIFGSDSWRECGRSSWSGRDLKAGAGVACLIEQGSPYPAGSTWTPARSAGSFTGHRLFRRAKPLVMGVKCSSPSGRGVPVPKSAPGQDRPVCTRGWILSASPEKGSSNNTEQRSNREIKTLQQMQHSPIRRGSIMLRYVFYSVAQLLCVPHCFQVAALHQPLRAFCRFSSMNMSMARRKTPTQMAESATLNAGQ